jgi:hypothetical protein
MWTPTERNYWWSPKTGNYPAPHALQPGDVILFQPRSPDLAQRVITHYQQGNPATVNHAGFTHAAIYVDCDGLVLEAVRSDGVRLSCLDDILEGNHITIRRAPGLTVDQRHAIARGAAFYRNHPYALMDLLKSRLGDDLATARLCADGGAEAPIPETAVICSTLCARALLSAGVSVLPPRASATELPPFVTPAWLAASPNLDTVEYEWRRVEHSLPVPTWSAR